MTNRAELRRSLWKLRVQVMYPKATEQDVFDLMEYHNYCEHQAYLCPTCPDRGPMSSNAHALHLYCILRSPFPEILHIKD